ncbi:MAG: PQQ-dependent sugar dehydrogenase [Anaerolineae bacterium]|nr:PQQ-dependent sugar dehydrogenase [Anaerolineae bacterium]
MNLRFQRVQTSRTAVLVLIVTMGIAIVVGASLRQTAVAQADPQSQHGSPSTYLPLITVPLPPPLTDPYTNAFSNPTFVTHAGDNRLFVVQKEGTIQVLHPDGQTSLFLDISERVYDNEEQGLFNLVFDPNYASNGYFYVTYTGWRYTPDEEWFFVARYQVTNGWADPNSECRFLGNGWIPLFTTGAAWALTPLTAICM